MFIIQTTGHLPVGYLLIWQSSNQQGALAPNLPTPFPLWPLGLMAQGYCVGSIPFSFLDPFISICQSAIVAAFYINIFVSIIDVSIVWKSQALSLIVCILNSNNIIIVIYWFSLPYYSTTNVGLLNWILYLSEFHR